MPSSETENFHSCKQICIKILEIMLRLNMIILKHYEQNKYNVFISIMLQYTK